MPFIHVRYSTPLEKDLRQPIAAFVTETTARILRQEARGHRRGRRAGPAHPLVHRRPLPRRSPEGHLLRGGAGDAAGRT